MLKRCFLLILILFLLLPTAACRKKVKYDDPSSATVPASNSAVDIYWNMHRDLYYDPQTEKSNRQPGADGLYHIRFALNGAEVELTCSSPELVNQIDKRAIMALTPDEHSHIHNVLDVSDVCILAVDGFFVSRIDGNTFSALPTVTFSGMVLEFEITPDTRIYNVSPNAEICSEPTELCVMDKIIVLQATEDGPATHIFVQRPMKADVFWRVEKTADTWDEANNTTTRIPDENGVYTIPMAKDGQLVDVLCKDIEIVNAIDSLPAGEQAIGLHIGKDGFADIWTKPQLAILGYLDCSGWTVTEIGFPYTTLTCTLPTKENGSVHMFKSASDCRIYDTTGLSGHVGIEVDSLKLGDQILRICSGDGKMEIIYIIGHSEEY